LRKSGWTSAFASALGRAGSNKIGVYPVSLGANREPMEFWSSFYALGCLTAYAKVHRDGELLDRFAFGRITPVQGRDVPALVDGFPKQPGIFLLSHYVWNHQVNCDFAERIKRRAPGSLVIVGGPHIPRDAAACEKYFAAHPYVDAAVRHEGEVTLADLLGTIAKSGVEPSDLARADLSAVEGLTVRQNGRLVRTPDRARHTAAYKRRSTRLRYYTLPGSALQCSTFLWRWKSPQHPRAGRKRYYSSLAPCALSSVICSDGLTAEPDKRLLIKGLW